MKIHPLSLTLYILIVCLIPQSSQPCTTFCFDKGNQMMVGNNMDWMIGEGLVIVNKRNVSKKAFLQPEWDDNGQPASWISKYGSVTFNFIGREFPFGGMNESGLVITCMWLEATEYPNTDSRPSIEVEQWKQYQLDNFSTVQEVLASDSQIRIATKSLGEIHFLVSDKTGNCAIIEFLGGKRIIYTKEKMPAYVLANISYKESIDYWQEGKLPTSSFWNSEQRFATAADMMKKLQNRQRIMLLKF
jgi:penicillin V acylase-like amidase (Ntn superfamily)